MSSNELSTFSAKEFDKVTRNISFVTAFSSHTYKSIILVTNYKTDNKWQKENFQIMLERSLDLEINSNTRSL